MGWPVSQAARGVGCRGRPGATAIVPPGPPSPPQSCVLATLCSPRTATWQVTAIFGSSAEVLVSLWGETPDEGVMFHCGDAYATVVSGER